MTDAQIQVGPDGLLTPAVDYTMHDPTNVEDFLNRYMVDHNDVIEPLKVICNYLMAVEADPASLSIDADSLTIAVESIRDAILVLGGEIE